MTLKKKFSVHAIRDYKCVEIAEDFAIGFRDFCNKRANEKPLSNVGLSSKELLEIYKKENEL